MTIIGYLMIVIPFLFTVWWNLTEHPHKHWAALMCFIALFLGITLVFGDRITEMSLNGIGTIKAAATRAATDAEAIASLKKRVEAQSATVDIVAANAKEARELVNLLSEREEEAEVKIAQLDKATKEAEKLTSFLSTVLAAENDDYVAFQSLQNWADDRSFNLNEAAATAYTRIRVSLMDPIRFHSWLRLKPEGMDPEKISINSLRNIFNKLDPIYHSNLVITVRDRDDITKYDKMAFFVHVLHSSNSMIAKSWAAKYFLHCANDAALKWEPFQINPLLKWWDEHKESVKEIS